MTYRPLTAYSPDPTLELDYLAFARGNECADEQRCSYRLEARRRAQAEGRAQ